MAIIRPFKPYRPTPEMAPRVAALPYDVVNTEEARAITTANPFSFLRVNRAEVDLPPEIDPHDPHVYQQAKHRLHQIIDDGTLVREAAPQFYLYKEVMRGRSQVGLVACAAIDDYLSGTIKVHEFTRADKELDRTNYVDVCNANTGLVFLTYRAQDRISAIIHAWMRDHEPVNDFLTDDGIQHVVWGIDDIQTISDLTELFGGVESFYIADGHHRAASAVKVGQMRREQHPDYTGDEPFNYFLVTLVPDTDLCVMDYNRVVRDLNGLSSEEFIHKVAEKFMIEPCLINEPYSPTAAHLFGMYLDGKWHKLTAKPNTFDESNVIERLDVSILQHNLLAPILGICDPKTDQRIDFVGGIRGLEELERRVASDMRVAFALYPTSVHDVMAVADAGKIMPPKSTWFEPKLRCGLFVYVL